MPTTKYRINISVSDDMKEVLVKSAKRDQMPTATKAERLLRMALEIEEDEYWVQVAAKRDRKDAVYVPHSKAWK